MPKLEGLTVCVDNIIVAGHDVVRANLIVPNVHENPRSQLVNSFVDATVVWSICKGLYIGPAGTKFACTAVPVSIAGQDDGPQSDRSTRASWWGF